MRDKGVAGSEGPAQGAGSVGLGAAEEAAGLVDR